MRNIFALCKLCTSTTRIGIDDDMGMETAEEMAESSRTLSDANSQTVLAGALLAKSKMLSSGQNDAAPVSAEAVTVLRSMSTAHPGLLLFLADPLNTHVHHLSRADRKGESNAARRDAVEHWQRLKITPGDAVTRLWRGLFSTWSTSVRQTRGRIPGPRSSDLHTRPSTCSAKSYHEMHRASTKHFVTSQLAY